MIIIARTNYLSKGSERTLNIIKQVDTQLNSSKKAGNLQSSPSLRSKEPLLGNTTSFASNQSQQGIQGSVISKTDSNTQRYKLQRVAKKYHPNSRLQSCMCTVAPDATNVQLHYNDNDRHAHYRNIMRCDNVWLCPVCSGRITSRRAEEIKQGYVYALETLGFKAVMVTYTLRHSRFDSLQSNLDAIREARRKMRSGRKWQDFKANYGYVGAISSLEVTASLKNGWHTHVHELMFLDPKNADYDLSVSNERVAKWLDHDLSQWWQSSLEKLGRTASIQHGIEISTSDAKIGDYIAKFGKMPNDTTWHVGLEIAKSQSKADTDGLHPFTILERSDNPCVPEAERKQYRAMWHEYAEAFSGRKQIYWTNGLKDLLLVDVVEDDSDIEESGNMVFGLSRDAWRAIVYTHKQADLLNECIWSRGDINKIEYFLKRVIADANRMASVAQHRKDNPPIYPH